MWIDYRERISEGVEELARAERAVRGTAMADRVKLLRLLKAGEQRSLAGAAALLGYSERQAQRWWQCYSKGGLAVLAQPARRHGGRERVTAAAWQALEAKLRAGEVARLRDARDYLRAQWGIDYTVGGVSKLFQRRRCMTPDQVRGRLLRPKRASSIANTRCSLCSTSCGPS